MNLAVMFSSAVDTWTTPRDYFAEVNAEFNFGLDAAALQVSTLVPDNWYGPDHPEIDRQDAFKRDWVADSKGLPIWLNPPYGRGIGRWTAYASEMCRGGGRSRVANSR